MVNKSIKNSKLYNQVQPIPPPKKAERRPLDLHFEPSLAKTHFVRFDQIRAILRALSFARVSLHASIRCAAGLCHEQTLVMMHLSRGLRVSGHAQHILSFFFGALTAIEVCKGRISM